MKRVKIIISGRVTGIGFRYFINVNADKLNIKGWVRNRDNKVEGIFEGGEDSVDKLIELCKKGPWAAKVVDIEIEEEEYTEEFSDFRVVH